jgi:hypothetical protein
MSGQYLKKLHILLLIHNYIYIIILLDQLEGMLENK